MSAYKLIWGAILLSISAAGGCKGTDGNGAAQMPFVVTAQQRERAMELLEQEDNFRAMTDAGPTYLVDIEVLRDKDGAGDRELLVTHYRPRGDLAILSRVNLSRNAVINVETVAHLPVKLSIEEFEMARRMALSNPEIKELIGAHTVEVEALVSRTFDEDDPMFGHRIVNLLFKTPQGYLEIPSVTVDLTSKTITIVKGAP